MLRDYSEHDYMNWRIFWKALWYVEIVAVTEMLVNILNICSDDELMSDSEEAGETEGETRDCQGGEPQAACSYKYGNGERAF